MRDPVALAGIGPAAYNRHPFARTVAGPRARSASPRPLDVNGLSLLALIAVACAVVVAYRYGRMAARRDAPAGSARPAFPRAPAAAVVSDARSSSGADDGPAQSVAPPVAAHDAAAPALDRDADAHRRIDDERTRLVIAYESEMAMLRRRATAADAERYRQDTFAEERRTLLRELATARGDVARYRQVVVDLENDAPPPILGGPGAPDDLKLIVGIGPALERMLQQLGIASYRQIARWTEHDIDAFDARLPEFPGRIRRDAWVTQARELHFNKYGERP